ncbi:hypothetical protein BOTBODRAFT_120303 [Botryobasidium botryosum FD-172 SS1]|uniref:MTHFR SAM-binding regulatory domain-containing protein n=1 Tax=Botryobasidium botryosum (strain FD-172 SS1) TaxID=930990 RepID=A0A067M6N1_BOTB1|nr:hypothetical protein BOTBODRAFT_120303 [Botryobasidium botryosum FD-172 SS1]
MKFTDKISQHSSKPFFSFEFFPPRTDQGFSNLLARIKGLSALEPLAISVTWGAGGTTKQRSVELAGIVQSQYGVDTVLHLTCTNMERGMVDDVLRAAKKLGIQNIFALRGGMYPPHGSDHWIPADPRFVHAADLVAYIRSIPEYADYFCIGVAGYPEGHTEAEPGDDQIGRLKAKVDAGADYVVTQLFYDVNNFFVWLKEVRRRGISVPIIPGVMPIQTYASFIRLNKLCGTRVPPYVSSDLETIRHDDQKVKDYGVHLAMSIIRRLTANGEVCGIHLCTFNLEKSVRRVLGGLGWTNDAPPQTNDQAHRHLPPDVLVSAHEVARAMSTTPSQEPDPFSVQSTATASTAHKLTPGWDDFPNGRFGDPTSPAYGAYDMWDCGINLNEGIAQWGNPKSTTDLTSFFLSYLNSAISTTPFSPEPLNVETSTILPHLIRLTSGGLWTVGSQPAVDAAPSSDGVFGWGPRGGYVFQKSFVEFFCDRRTVEWIKERVNTHGKGLVSFYAGDGQNDFFSNAEEGRNAVTWGVFPDQEIVQSTIIERDSFAAWMEEAFGIWYQWALFYPPDSAERELLEKASEKLWLVSIIHHDYKNPESLWDFLFEGEGLPLH